MVKWEKIDETRVAMEVEVDEDALGQALDQAYKKVVQQVNLPGFRKGKVPRPILESRFGTGILYEEALERLVPDAYDQAVETAGIKPLDKPEIDVVQLEKGKPFIFKATVEVMPEVALGEYCGVEVTETIREISEDDVAAKLEQLRRQHVKLRELEEGTLEEGDLAVIDFTGYRDDVPFEGGQGEGYSLEIGSGTFIPGFEEQLVGASAGEEREVRVSFPVDYHAEHLAGQGVLFKVLVREIKRKEIPLLEDSFAAEVSEFATLAELKEETRNKLKTVAEKTARRELDEQVVGAVVANASVSLPTVLVEREIERLMREMEQILRMQGLSFEKYLSLSGKSLQELREERREEAGKRVRANLVLEAVAKKEGIEATNEEVDGRIAEMAANYKQDFAKVKEYFLGQGQMEALLQEIKFSKTIDFLRAQAQVSAVTADAASKSV